MGWQLRNSVKIKYLAHSGEETERLIDPFILTYYNNAWYVKAFCHLKKDIRIFAIHRIHKTELTKYTFETDQKIISESTKGSSLFLFEEIKDIELWCSKEIAGYVIEQSKTRGQKITENEDGSVVVYISSAPRLDMIKWVLSEGGEAKVIKPAWLWEEVVNRAKTILHRII
jgi:predicted DNA-binding transcriptional regulator YafY